MKWTQVTERALAQARAVFDGWKNIVTQIGTSLDKLTWHRPSMGCWLQTEELEALYYEDWICQRIVREVVDAGLRQGFELSPPAGLSPETAGSQSTAILDLLWDLEAVDKLTKGLYWGRLYGRGGLLLGADDGGESSSPLVSERVKGLLFVEDIDRAEFSPVQFQTDPLAKDYGQPTVWQVQLAGGQSSQTVKVHSSRLLLTGGVPTSRRIRAGNDWSDASVLQPVFDAVRNYSSATLGVAHMLTDSSQAVLAIKDLIQMLGQEDITVFANRMRVLEMARTTRIMPIDADGESFSYVERSFSGVAELLDRAMAEVAGAAGMPQTVLFGRSPAGMNATGESDVRGWYDQVQAYRTAKVQPALEQLVYLAATATGASTPEEWGVTWPSLWQRTDEEEAAYQRTIAETDDIYIANGTLTADEVTAHRFGGDAYDSSPVLVDLEEREREEDEEPEEEPATPPPLLVQAPAEQPEELAEPTEEE